MAAALVPLTAEGSLPRTSLDATNTAAQAGAEAVDSGRLIAAGLETPFTLLAGDALEKALTCNPTPSVESLTSAEGARLEPPPLTSRACEASFSLHMEPVDFGLNPQRGPPLEIPDLHQGWFVAEPETRIGGFRLNPEDLIGGERQLSLCLHRGYLVGRPGFTEDEPPDPWGLFELSDVWKAVETYVEVGLDTSRRNLKSAAKLGLGMVDVAAGGRISGAVRALDSAASTKGPAGERLAAAYGAYERGKRATMSMGFSEAEDKVQHAKDLVGVGGIDRGSSQLAEGILEGDLDRAGRGLAEFAGGVGQLSGTATIPAAAGGGISRVTGAADMSFLGEGAGEGFNAGLSVPSGQLWISPRFGGPHRLTKISGRASGTESHHLIADAVSDIATDAAPAIRMLDTDHWLTASHGRRGLAGRAFRSQQAQEVQQGRYDAAFQLGINDVRTLFGSRYDAAIEEARNMLPRNPDGSINWTGLPKKKAP